ncbi:hypothetical protein AB7645_01880 [Bradyrhizobium sp. 956_D2_N1_5]|uniref:hypothetical protein n=1 Tax=unclassified Bradyrhizobium TaxID=2631580 RepID=UPI003F240A91
MEQNEAGSNSPTWRVLFGPRSATSEDSSLNIVWIVSAADNWNDFGHQTGIDYEFRVRGTDHSIEVSGYIGFISSEGRSDRALLAELASSTSHGAGSAKSPPLFFTMLPNMDAYRRLVQALGADDAANALLAAHDLVALGEFEPTSDILQRAVETEVFSLSFMRSSDTFFAFKNAGPILRGLSSEELGRLSPTLAIRFQLPGRTNEHDLKFHFDHHADLPKRIAVIIGKNGVGKS